MISTVLPSFPGSTGRDHEGRAPPHPQPSIRPAAKRAEPPSAYGCGPPAARSAPRLAASAASHRERRPAVRHRWPSCCSNVIRASHDAGTGRIGALEPRAGGGSGLRGLGPAHLLSHRHRQQQPPQTTAGGAGGQRRGCCSQVAVATWLLQPRRWPGGSPRRAGSGGAAGGAASQPGAPAREGAGVSLDVIVARAFRGHDGFGSPCARGWLTEHSETTGENAMQSFAANVRNGDSAHGKSDSQAGHVRKGATCP
jgi:hypothetical protein